MQYIRDGAFARAVRSISMVLKQWRAKGRVMHVSHLQTSDRSTARATYGQSYKNLLHLSFPFLDFTRLSLAPATNFS